MTEKKAKRIEELRCGPVIHSWRRISEIICEEFADEDNEMSGNQIHGKYDLCWEAMAFLYGNGEIGNVPNEIRDKWNS